MLVSSSASVTDDSVGSRLSSVAGSPDTGLTLSVPSDLTTEPRLSAVGEKAADVVDCLAAGAVPAVAGPGCAEGGHYVVAGVSQKDGQPVWASDLLPSGLRTKSPTPERRRTGGPTAAEMMSVFDDID